METQPGRTVPTAVFETISLPAILVFRVASGAVAVVVLVARVILALPFDVASDGWDGAEPVHDAKGDLIRRRKGFRQRALDHSDGDPPLRGRKVVAFGARHVPPKYHGIGAHGDFVQKERPALDIELERVLFQLGVGAQRDAAHARKDNFCFALAAGDQPVLVVSPTQEVQFALALALGRRDCAAVDHVDVLRLVVDDPMRVKADGVLVLRKVKPAIEAKVLQVGVEQGLASRLGLLAKALVVRGMVKLFEGLLLVIVIGTNGGRATFFSKHSILRVVYDNFALTC